MDQNSKGGKPRQEANKKRLAVEDGGDEQPVASRGPQDGTHFFGQYEIRDGSGPVLFKGHFIDWCLSEASGKETKKETKPV